MNGIDYDRLLFRKQFLLTSKKIDGLHDWKRYSVCSGKKMLHVHPDMEITIEEMGDRKVILLGCLLDWRSPEQGNGEIVRRILAQSLNFAEFVESTADLGGRFAIIYEDAQGSRVFHDAGGQREIYYHLGEHGVSCAAQLPILARFMDVVENPNEDIRKLYDSDSFLNFKKQWVGEDTIYRDTKNLKPNHYIDMESGNAKRYWPIKPLEKKRLEEVVDEGAAMLKGFLKAASFRKELIIPVTAGWDSRLLLAASRDISDKVLYYIIKFPHMSDSHMDIDIPRRLLKNMGLELSVIEASEHVDERFFEIFGNNTAYCKDENLPGIYNVFFKMFPDRINVTSQMSEVVRNYKGNTARYNDRFYDTCIVSCSRNDYYENNYVKETSSKWIENTLDFAKGMNIDPRALFYWEEWLSWEASQRSETDIAIEEYPPFSCRNLMALLLSVKPSYRNAYNCTLYKRLMEKMWPEVLSEPINPSFKRNIKGALVAIEMLYPVKNMIKNMKGK